MKLAVSNIAMPSFEHLDAIRNVAQCGLDGLEVAPSKVWRDTLSITPGMVDKYRREVEKEGLRIVGVHSLLYDQPHLGIFKIGELYEQTLDFLTHISRVCADLGGVTMVFGSPQARKRDGLSTDRADDLAVDFFTELCSRIHDHGTMILIEALGRSESDYIHSLEDVRRIIERVNAPSLGYHFDTKAAIEANDANPVALKSVADRLSHVHVNEAGLGVLAGDIDHGNISSLLREIDYEGYVSLEQRMVDQDDIWGPLQSSIDVLRKYYGD